MNKITDEILNRYIDGELSPKRSRGIEATDRR